MQAARQLGIRTPETLSVPDESALEGCIDAIGLPAVLKSDGSWGGEGVIIVRAREQALAAYRRLANRPSRLKKPRPRVSAQRRPLFGLRACAKIKCRQHPGIRSWPAGGKRIRRLERRGCRRRVL